VPTAHVKPSILPPVWRHISGPVVELFREPARIFYVVVRVSIRHRRHFDQFGAAQPDHVFLFVALGFRNDDDRAISKRIANQREADARVACRALDDHASGFERAAPFCFSDNEKRGPVLYGAAGVEEFTFAKNFAPRRVRDSVEPNEWRISDQIDETGFHFHDMLNS